MDTVLIEKIIKMFETSNVSHLELEVDNVKIKLDKDSIVSNNTVVENKVVEKEVSAPKEENAKGLEINSPLVGVFYEAPSMDSKPFVTVGSHVKKGDKLCIIEAMKVMNEITSPYDGVIKEIYPKNQSMVEYGTQLFRIEE